MSRQRRFSRDHLVFTAILLAGFAALFYGWQVFWFLTDDAFIAFRYISNSIDGLGYVWNPPPFKPVEGYTSFLWVFVLDGVWRLTGIEPPESSNLLALAFSLGTLTLSALMMWKVCSGERLRSWRNLFVALLVLFMVFNRTFLAWSSSGLETGMFTFFFVSWVFVLLCVPQTGPRLVLAGFASAFLTLTRPDGLLFCAALMGIVVVEILRAANPRDGLRCALAALLPLFLVVIHIAWRKSFYGEWLPNTYYAKVSGVSPATGLLYFASFTLEYALWIPLGVLAWLLAAKSEPLLRALPSVAKPAGFLDWIKRDGVPIAVTGAVLGHFVYYTVIVGGDHFEYRVYNHLIPFSFLGLVWMLSKIDARPAVSTTVAVSLLLFSIPIPWTHWMLTRNLDTRELTYRMSYPVTPAMPGPVKWYGRMFDSAQRSLINQHICMRHQEHKTFHLTYLAKLPTRALGSQISGEENPVVALASVGIPSWVLPNVAVIDVFGLNDYVIARTPLPDNAPRLMAHSRYPPFGYVESFRPNIRLEDGRTRIYERSTPLTSEDIARIEQSWIERIGSLEPFVPEDKRL